MNNDDMDIPNFLKSDLIRLEEDKCLHNTKVIEKINMESTPRGRIDYTVCSECGEILNKRIWK